MFLASFQQFQTQMDNEFRGLDDVIAKMSKANIPAKNFIFPTPSTIILNFRWPLEYIRISHQPIV